MKKNKKKFFLLFIISLIIFTSGCITINIPQERENPDKIQEDYQAKDKEYKKRFLGTKLDNLDLINLEGEKYNFNKEDNYMVYFSDTTCSACTDLIKEINSIDIENLDIVGIYPYDSKQEVVEHFKENKIDNIKLENIIVGIENIENNDLVEKYDLYAFPTVFFMKNKKIDEIILGSMEKEEIIQILNK
jgi:thioredoxin-related protein